MSTALGTECEEQRLTKVIVVGAEERDVEVAGCRGDGGDDVDPGREVGLGVQT